MAARNDDQPLYDAIVSLITPSRKVKPWYELIPKNVLKDLEKLKSNWLNGQVCDSNGKQATKSCLARSISKTLRDRKVAEVGVQGIVAWLNKH